MIITTMINVIIRPTIVLGLRWWWRRQQWRWWKWSTRRKVL